MVGEGFREAGILTKQKLQKESGGSSSKCYRDALNEWYQYHTIKRCIEITQTMHLEKRGEGNKISQNPQMIVPEKPGQ